MRTKKHHLIPCEAGGKSINGHSAFYCSVNNITILSNNDMLGDKWYIDEARGETFNTIWFPTPTAAAIAYFDSHNI